MLNCDHEMASDVDRLTDEADAPLQPNDAGVYPIPQPGIITDWEYA